MSTPASAAAAPAATPKSSGPAYTPNPNKRSGALLGVLAWIIGLLFVLPVVWMVWISFHSENDAATNPPKFDAPFSTEGYKNFFDSNPWPSLANSLTASVVSTLILSLIHI